MWVAAANKNNKRLFLGKAVNSLEDEIGILRKMKNPYNTGEER